MVVSTVKGVKQLLSRDGPAPARQDVLLRSWPWVNPNEMNSILRSPRMWAFVVVLVAIIVVIALVASGGGGAGGGGGGGGGY